MLVKLLLLSLSRMLLCSADSNIHKTSLPILDLPYGRWRASTYDNSTDIYTFRNIRYAAPPSGKLRWAAPVSPESVKGVQDGSYGPACIQLPNVTFAGGPFTVNSTSEGENLKLPLGPNFEF